MTALLPWARGISLAILILMVVVCAMAEPDRRPRRAPFPLLLAIAGAIGACAGKLRG